VELGQDVPLDTMLPVMDDTEFEQHCDAIRSALGATPTAV
jgi:hypothetical protein